MKKRILAIAFCLMMTFTVMGHIGCIPGTEVYAATATMSVNGNWQGGTTLTENTTWTFNNGAIVTLAEPVTIPKGKTLTLKGWGGFARDSGTKGINTNALFVIQSGGKLVLKGTSKDKPIIIDGKNVIANTSLIVSSGAVECEYAQIQNGKNRSVYAADHKNAGKPNGTGGGIIIGTTGSLTMKNCVVTRNTASLNGGGIYSTGPVMIENSEITYNRAMSTETGDGVVNAGRGGGFYFGGENVTFLLEDVTVSHNAAMYYGGGGQICSNGSLTMSGNTTISNNAAILHGAGGLHVTADAIFTMNGGSIDNNTAQTVGGGIHSSYSCVLNLNSGSISNNTANGRGGGVHVNTGGAITLGEGLIINENQAKNQPTGSSANVDATGDNWSNVKAESAHYMNGYGGGVLIDSGTCTVAGATISGNKAAVGGGGIALTMINLGDGGLDDFMVVSFKMTSGTISGNEADGDGAGVYLMSNKAKENLERYYDIEGSEEYEVAIQKISDTNRHIENGTYKDVDDMLNGVPVASVSGGTINNNKASNSGGGLYLDENTKFIIEGTGDISKNEAKNGAGVYVASGTAEINGGTMTGNVATVNGGALYVNGTVDMSAGTISNNKVAANGGAVYVGSDGDITMSGGSLTENTAVNGGAVYVADGNMMIHHGSLNLNTAYKGGAVYMAGGEGSLLTMESGTMNGNLAKDNENTTEEVEGDGGAIYATSGTIRIGLEGCNGDEDHDYKHTDLGEGRHHPKINDNEADDTGGGIAVSDEGKVYFYCGNATGNEALYKGVGKNVFMQGGEFFLYGGANIGVPRDPDLVIIGGTLHNMNTDKEYVTLKYYASNEGVEGNVFQGYGELNEVMNLPDGEYFWDAPEGYRFFGWTAQGAASGEASNEFVRNKNQYIESGTPVEIIDAAKNSLNDDQIAYDGTSDGIMHLYALWAPIENDITYVARVDGEVEGEMTPKDSSLSKYNINDNEDPIIKTLTKDIKDEEFYRPGYKIKGWYIYQIENQNANWGYEPIYLDGTTEENKGYDTLDYDAMKGPETSAQYMSAKLDDWWVLPIQTLTFGDIVLIADYESQYADLEITKSGEGIDDAQTFLFRITGDPANQEVADIDMMVTIQGTSSSMIRQLPVGKYQVTEITDWCWRYDFKNVGLSEKKNNTKKNIEISESQQLVNGIKEININDAEILYGIDFTNGFARSKWLSDEAYKNNYFNPNTQ